MTTQPINGLQQMMLRWEEFHALNAAHVVRLAPGLDPSGVEATVRATCRSLGLRPVEVLPGRRALRFADAPADDGPPVECRTAFGPARAAVEAILRDELNRPFAAGLDWPVRFVLLDHPADGPYLVLTYRHAVSDSRGISLILREIVRALHGVPPVVRRLDLTPPALETLFPTEHAPSAWWRRGRETLGELWASRKCLRPAGPPPAEFAIVPAIHPLTLETARLKRTSRGLGVTVQDVVLAALLEALAVHFGPRLSTSRRKALAVYTPADLRRDSPEPLDAAFGTFLGCITARQTVEPDGNFPALVARVAEQTRRIKATRSYRLHPSQMGTMAWLWDRATRRLNRTTGPALVPMAGFISNVNLTDYLADEIAAGQVAGYERFTGTGIIAPLMLGITTLGGRVGLTTTHHSHVFTPPEVARIVAHVHGRLAGDREAPAESTAEAAAASPGSAVDAAPLTR